MSKSGLWVPNGGEWPSTTMGVTPYRVQHGWPKEAASQIFHNFWSEMAVVLWHLPHGCRNPAAMEFDSLCWAREIPELALVCNNDELTACLLTCWHYTGAEQWIYMGLPENATPHLTRAWSEEKLNKVDQRIETCLRPYLKARDRGCPVRIVIDGSASKGTDSLTYHAYERITKHYGLPFGMEARPFPDSDWGNNKDIAIVAIRDHWHAQGDQGAIPEEKLQGPQWLICATEADCAAEMEAGRNVLYGGRLSLPAKPVDPVPSVPIPPPDPAPRLIDGPWSLPPKVPK